MLLGPLLVVLLQDKEALAEAAGKNTQELSSYKFNTEFEVQGFPGGGGDRGGRGAPRIEGTYHKDEGLHVRVGDSVEVVKKDKKIVHTDSSRNWKVFEDKPSDGGEDRDRRRRDWQKDMLKNIRAPHEEIKGIETKFKEVAKSVETERIDGQECAVYSGELTADGAKELMPHRGMLNRIENVELKGSAKVWVTDKGVVSQYQIKIDATGEFRNNPFNVTFTRTVTLTQANEARCEIPEEAKKLLEEPPAEEK